MVHLLTYVRNNLLVRRRINSDLDGVIIKLVKRKKRSLIRIHTKRYFHSGLIIDCDVIIYIDKTDPAEPTIREMYWMNTLKTMYSSSFSMEVNLKCMNDYGY